MKHFTVRKCKPTLNSREECSEFADLLFQYSSLKRVQRSFVQRHFIIRALYSIHNIFLQLSYIRHIFYTFHTTPSLHIYIAHAEYFLIPDDAVDRRKLGFQFLLFKQQFNTVACKGHYNIFFFCLSYRAIISTYRAITLNYRAIISQFIAP